MNTLTKVLALSAFLGLLAVTSGCEQIEEAKVTATDAVTQTVEEAKQAVGIETGEQEAGAEEEQVGQEEGAEQAEGEAGKEY